MSCHADQHEKPVRSEDVAAARKVFHNALEDRAANGVHMRRILCFDEPASADALEPRFFSRYTTDHCKRLIEIGKRHPSLVSVRFSKFYMPIDVLVIPSRMAAIAVDAFDPENHLKHVLCWFFFNPPNGNIIETLTERCEGIGNSATPIEQFPDGIVESTSSPDGAAKATL